MNRTTKTVIIGLGLVLAFGLAARSCHGPDYSASESATTTSHADNEQLWTCGMHPQVVEKEPGSCPICGMDLTPMKQTGASSSAPPSGERRIVYWRAPMDPTYIRDEPGKSPMGMDLIPVYEDELQSEGNLVEIAPGVVQQIGMETAVVERTTVFRHLRTIGEVEVGEDELTVVNLRFSGWVERLRVDKTGDEVRRGQVLFDIYSPELVSAQEEYLLAVRTQGADAPLTKSARRKLELWNLSSTDIEAVASSGEARRTMPIRSPASGFVLHKNIVEGARIAAGKDLYRIGNLQRIWVTAEVYEHDAPWISVDQPAQLVLTNLDVGTVDGKVSYIYPTLNEKSRTLTVRLEFDNPGVRLKPGMFATVYIQYRKKDDVLAIPTEAILHSGHRELVFVAHGKGRFEPREITTGLQGDHRVTAVTKGLTENELVVVNGQFLVDSESQLQEALRKIMSSGEAPSDEATSGTVWSCPMHPEVLSDEKGRCPECGMFLEERPGTAAELEKLKQGHAEPGQYTCPMHPDVVSDEAGRCPKCGMFLKQLGGEGHAKPAEGDHEGHEPQEAHSEDAHGEHP